MQKSRRRNSSSTNKSPFQRAIESNQQDLIKSCYAQNPQVLLETSSNGQNAFHWATRKGLTACQALFSLEGVTETFVNTKDSKGLTCLHLAATGSSYEILHFLVNQELVDVRMKTKEEETVLHLVARYFPVIEDELMKTLLLKGLNVNDKNIKGYAPMHFSSGQGCSNMTTLFIKFGGITNIQSNLGETPLHLATKNGHVHLVEILMKAGASPFIISEFGTPKDLAHNPQLVALLESPIIPALIPNTSKRRPTRSRAFSHSVAQTKSSIYSHTASHRILIQSLGEGRSVKRSIADKRLLAVLKLELLKELCPLFFEEEWLDRTIDFIVGQPVFEWVKADTIKNKVEIMKWLCEFIDGPEELQGYLRFIQKNYSEHIDIITVKAQDPKSLRETKRTKRSDRSESLTQSNSHDDIPEVPLEKTSSRRTSSSSESRKRSKSSLPSINSSSSSTNTGEKIERSISTGAEPLRSSGRYTREACSTSIAVASISSSSHASFHRQPSVLSSSSPDGEKKSRRRSSKSQSRHKFPSQLALRDRKLARYHWEISMDDLEFREKIGTGGFGHVHRGIWKEQEVAIKKLSIKVLDKSSVVPFLLEIALLSETNHKNVLKFIGACLGCPICLVTEYCINGDLSNYLQGKEIPWEKQLQFSLQVADGVNYLHTRPSPIVHRDIKCSNILVSEDEILKLADFGLGKPQSRKDNNGVAGTLRWCAPEILIDNEPCTTKADIYSFGMTLYEIISKGQIPYADMNELEALHSISIGTYPDLPSDLDPRFGDVLHMCWKSKEERPDCLQILVALQEIIKI